MHPPGEQRLSALLYVQEREAEAKMSWSIPGEKSVPGATVGSQHLGHLSFKRRCVGGAKILAEDSADLGGVPYHAVHLLCDLGKHSNFSVP